MKLGVFKKAFRLRYAIALVIRVSVPGVLLTAIDGLDVIQKNMVW